jgi:hypothetical protein
MEIYKHTVTIYSDHALLGEQMVDELLKGDFEYCKADGRVAIFLAAKQVTKKCKLVEEK